MTNEILLEESRLLDLVNALKRCSSDKERLALLEQEERVGIFFQHAPWIKERCGQLEIEEALILHSLIAIDEGDLLSGELQSLLGDLIPVERFYKALGGVVGYHMLMLSLLDRKTRGDKNATCPYSPPVGVDISTLTPQVCFYIAEGIEALAHLAEIYVVGGAADRLRLYDPVSGQPWPAAKLPFCGQSLLKGLIRDLQAREWLYFKLFSQQLTTPVALMTSSEKNNHEQIEKLCKEEGWFGRDQRQFFLFQQPLVPTMDLEGRWCVWGKGKLLMKPGGHGALWKKAQESGVFEWFKSQGRKKLLVRQINNPLAGIDYGLLAFCGVGCLEKKQFGFASCPRCIGSAEGVNVFIEKREGELFSYCLTNIEYCDFAKFSIQDSPTIPGGTTSQFPSNTNILFADINAVEAQLVQCPVPGMLVNVRSIVFTDEEGVVQEKEVVRLESTMQNLADNFVYRSSFPMAPREVPLETFLTYNKRHKTISTTKKMGASASLLETPEGGFYDVILNAHELLSEQCRMQIPPLSSPLEFLEQGPPFFFFYHPALGPLFSLIGQKVCGGSISWGSELSLEIAEVAIEELTLEGVLQVSATQILGGTDELGVIRYSDQVGQCVLRHVTVKNKGIDREAPNQYWERKIAYKERCEILIHGDGEFFAEYLTLSGDLRIEVEKGVRLIAFEQEGQLLFRKEPLQKKRWVYHLKKDGSLLAWLGC